VALVSSLIGRVPQAVALVAASLAVVACSHPAAHENTPTASQPVITEAPADFNEADLAFVNEMIALHRQGLDISALVAQRSNRADVNDFAQKSADSMQSAMRVLRTLRVQWVDATQSETPDNVPTTPAVKGSLDDAMLARLHASTGEEFDTLWLHSMLQLSQAEMRAANAEVASGKNPDALTLAKQIASTQQADVDEINQLLSA
jgi:uncharacterized protein (DUF305 family)